MSSVLRDMLGDEEEYYDDYSDEDQQQYSDEEPYPEDEEEPYDEEEELSKGVNLIELAQAQKTPSAPAPKKKKPKKTQQQNVIEYRDISELEYYENLKLGKNAKTAKVLDSIKYNLQAIESVKMSMDTFPITDLQIMTVNPAWIKRKNEITSEIIKKYNGGNRSSTFVEDQLRVLDKDGFKIDKFIYGTARGGLNVNLDYCLGRENYAICTIRDKIYIHGGDNLKSTYGDLIVIQPSQNSIIIYKEVTQLSVGIEESYGSTKKVCDIPVINNHAMVPLGETHLLIFGASARAHTLNDYYSYTGWENNYRKRMPGPNEMLLYIISIDPNNPENIHYGFKRYHDRDGSRHNGYRHPIRQTADGEYISHRQNFTVCTLGTDQYLFGGRTNNNNALDELFRIDVDMTQHTYNAHRIVKKANEVWPSRRYGHAAATINQSFIIFGGRSGSIVLNDLYIFDSTKTKWTEIDLSTNMLPPPAHNMGNFFGVSHQYLFFYGGRTITDKKQDRIFNTLYRYDTGEKQWSLIKVMGLVESSAASVQRAVCNHQCVVIDNNMYRIGGYGNDAKIPAEIVTLKNIADPGQGLLLVDYLKEKKDQGFMCDVIFRVREELEKEIDTIVEFRAHRAIIQARCPLLSELVANSTQISTTEFERVVITVDIIDCNAATFEAFLNYLYNGQIILDGIANINALLQYSEKWAPHHHDHISRICSPTQRMFLDTTDEILTTLQNDLFTLVNNDTNSDVTLALGGDGDNQEFVYAHRFILCRSPLFKSMFMSGMQESYSDIIELGEYSKDVMLALLRFIYTDNIVVTPSNCVGSLVYAQQFGLPEVSNFCRGMASRYLNNDNVFAVIDIAEVYNDGNLKRNCMKYIQSVYEDLYLTEAYKKLPDDIRTKIDAMYEKKKKQSKKK